MSQSVTILKDENNQTPVPLEWRGTFSEIVIAFVEDDFKLTRQVTGVRSISEDDAKRIEENIRSYGATLTKLPEATWNTSVCQWMHCYWDVLIDLYTVEEGASDLILSIRIYEEGEKYSFDVQSIHVP